MNESCFYVHKLAGIVLLINKQETNNKIEDKRNNFNSRFKFDSETDSQFVRNCFDRLTKYKKLLVVFSRVFKKEIGNF